MNIFNKHPKQNRFNSWWSHCKSATCVGIRLLFTSMIFIVHGLFPFIRIPKKLNLMQTALLLLEENEKRKKNK